MEMPDEIYLVPDTQGGACCIVSKYDSPGRVKYIPASRESALQERLEKAEALLKECEEALKMHMEWIGAPPTGPYDFDSLREDAWKKGQAVLSRISAFTGGKK